MVIPLVVLIAFCWLLRNSLIAQPLPEARLSAVADGLADATAVLQKILNESGTLELPAGRYRLSSSLELDLSQRGPLAISGEGTATLVMTGPGPAIRVRGTHFRSADPAQFEPTVWTRERMPLIRGIAIAGQHPEADGIAASGTMQLTLSQVHVRGCRHAVHLTNNNRNVLISDCHFYENSGCGVFYDDVNLHQSNITGSHISYNGGGGVVSLKGNVRNLHITGCDIESNMRPDLPATANVLIDCRESQYGTGEVAITGCTIQHNNPSPDSANIRIIGRSLPSASQALVQEGNVTITGNVLSDVQVNLHLVDVRGATVSANTLWQGYRQNLLFENCSNLVVTGNNLDRNPRYDYGNTADANNAAVIRNCADCTFSGLHVSNVWREPAGVLFENCRRIQFSDSTILDCDACGVWLNGLTDSYVHDLLIRDDRPDSSSLSLRVTGGSGNVIRQNVLQRPELQEP
jgi:hypothetical protein